MSPSLRPRKLVLAAACWTAAAAVRAQVPL